MKNVCGATITCMQLFLPVSSVVTIEMGSRLTSSSHCLATVLSPLNWQLFPVCLLFNPLSFAIHILCYSCSTGHCHWNSEMTCGACTSVCTLVKARAPDVALKCSNRPWRGGKYQGSPESSERQCAVSYWTWSPLYWRTNWKSVSLSKHSLGLAQLKETIAVWH